MIVVKVATVIRGFILELFRSIKTDMIELFDNRYDDLTEAAAAADTEGCFCYGDSRGEIIPISGLRQHEAQRVRWG